MDFLDIEKNSIRSPFFTNYMVTHYYKNVNNFFGQIRPCKGGGICIILCCIVGARRAHIASPGGKLPQCAHWG